MGIKPIFDPHNWSAVPFHFWSLVFFVLGCMVGSFLNVCIHRLPLGLSIVTLITWLALRGRCKNCGAPISPRYFVVELLTGVAFLGCWLAFGEESAALALVYAIFIAGMIAATFIDFEHFIIPDEITLGGIVAGFAASFFLPSLQGERTVGWGMLQSVIGVAAGAGTIYAILRLGKLLFGRQRVKLPPDTKVVFTETAVHLPDRVIPFEEVFYRKSDTIVFHAKTLELVDRGYKDVSVRLSPPSSESAEDGPEERRQAGGLKIGEEVLNPEDVPYMEAVCTEIILPREAMGLGDVKFMGAIGAFIGWRGVIFSLMISSMIGAVVGVTLIVMRRRQWSSRMPYGPYIALAAVIWIFAGQRIVHAIFR